MDYNEVSSTDIAEQALSQAIDDHIENSEDVIDHIEGIEVKIHSWNMEDIRELNVMFTEIRELLKKHFQVQIRNFMNMNNIPSHKVPEVLRQVYKIVAMDKRGYALYGNEMDKIAHVKRIAENYQQRVTAKQQAQLAKK